MKIFTDLVSALVCGVDEAGRGPLCGSVVAAAVILDPNRPIDGLADSKKLTAKRRDKLAMLIRERAIAWCVAEASVEEIDRLNILHATMLAMQRAVEGLNVTPTKALIDGNRCPTLRIPAEAVVGGDASIEAISAASILAKTSRDAAMLELDQVHPEYGFAKHKGYPTAQHFEAIRLHGVLDCHRRSFAPVRAQLAQQTLFDDIT